jgi:hypothetical protein
LRNIVMPVLLKVDYYASDGVFTLVEGDVSIEAATAQELMEQYFGPGGHADMRRIVRESCNYECPLSVPNSDEVHASFNREAIAFIERDPEGWNREMAAAKADAKKFGSRDMVTGVSFTAALIVAAIAVALFANPIGAIMGGVILGGLALGAAIITAARYIGERKQQQNQLAELDERDRLFQPIIAQALANKPAPAQTAEKDAIPLPSKPKPRRVSQSTSSDLGEQNKDRSGPRHP